MARSSVVSRTPLRISSSTSSGVRPVTCPSTRSTGTERHLPRPHRLLAVLVVQQLRGRRGPVETALLPDVDVRDEHERDEDRHLDQPEQAELAERDGPREEEDRLDVED